LQRNLSYTEDILDDLELNTKKYQDIVSDFFEFIAQETKEKEVYAIELHKIGVLHKNMRMLQNHKTTKSRDSEDYKDLEDQIAMIKWFKEDSNFKTPHANTPGSWCLKDLLDHKYDLQPYDTLNKQHKMTYAALEKETIKNEK
jgi:nucleoid DNA-binding protein